jgi:hypothetical protein
MAEIPTDLPASAAQSTVQAREIAKDRDARQAGEAAASNRQLKSVDEAGSTVETGDEDVAVFADAEGTGSQGRMLDTEEAPDTEEEADDGSRRGGVTRGDDGQLHVDIEA